MDVKNAFVNGDLQEVVYVQQPLCYICQGEEHKVLNLHQALYGLHQAPRAWNKMLDIKLSALGFTKCPYDSVIYYRCTKN